MPSARLLYVGNRAAASCPTTQESAASFPICKDNTLWCSFSAAAVTAPRTAGRPRGLFSSIGSLRLPIAAPSRSVPTAQYRGLYCRSRDWASDGGWAYTNRGRAIVETNEYRSGVGAHWPVLSDVRRLVQKDLDIAEYTDPTHDPMIPHVIVLEPGLVIYKIYNGYWFFGRPTLEDLRQDLRAVTMKCRPDWDITTPELKAAWEQGRKDLFYPYGKTNLQTLDEQD